MSIPKITKTDQKVITEKWKAYFPEMEVFEPMMLINIINPFLVGLCLEIKSDRNKYYPRVFLHNLARIKEDLTFDFSITKSNYIISSISTEDKVNRIINELKTNTLIPTAGDIKYFEFIDNLKIYCEGAFGIEQLSILQILFYLESWFNEGNVASTEEFAARILAQKKIILTEKEQRDWIKGCVDEVSDVNKLKNNVRLEKIKWNLQTFPHRTFVV